MLASFYKARIVLIAFFRWDYAMLRNDKYILHLADEIGTTGLLPLSLFPIDPTWAEKSLKTNTSALRAEC